MKIIFIWNKKKYEVWSKSVFYFLSQRMKNIFNRERKNKNIYVD